MNSKNIIDIINRCLSKKGIDKNIKENRVQFDFIKGEYKWSCVIRLHGERVSVFSKYPFEVNNKEDAEKSKEMAVFSNEINRTLSCGCMVSDEQGCVYFKQVLAFNSILDVENLINISLDEQCFVITKYWNKVKKQSMQDI